MAVMTEQHTDPRPAYDQSLDWARERIAAVRPEQLDAPTPCGDWDVRILIGHLVATVDRARVIGQGGDLATARTVVTDVPDDGWVDAHRTATERMQAVWADDALLDTPVTVPWGTVPGRAALWGYLNESLVHGWDLAVATGQEPEADPGLAAAGLAAARRVLPAEMRGDGIPFDAVVEPAPDAGPTERLANWAGRSSRDAAR